MRRRYGRYREILAILTRHGFGWVLAQLNLKKQIPIEERLRPSRSADPNAQAIHLRLAFEELGPTFIKLGQVLSTRSDLLPPAYIEELVLLQDAAPAVDYEQISAIIEAELGGPPEDVFEWINPLPLAAASIGQVHEARLKGGQEVVVKVQRPGVQAQVERDLDIILDLARRYTQLTELGAILDASGLAEEFAFNLRCELDYVREGQSADQIRDNFAANDRSHIPEIYWDYTTGRVLVMERLRGVKVNDLQALDALGIDRKQLGATSVQLMLEEMFVHGFFHADPHPGNLLVAEDGVIGMMDFGMMGHLDSRFQDSLTRLFMAMDRRDSERVIDEMATMGILNDQLNRRAFKRDVDHLIMCYANRPLEDLAAANIFGELTTLARRHHLSLPNELVLVAKVMALAEGTGLLLDPEFDFVTFAQPYLEKHWLQRRSPAKIGEQMAEGLLDLAEFGISFPRRITRLAAQLERGELGGKVEVRGIDAALDRLQKMAYQLAAAILVSALIIGLSQFIHMVNFSPAVQALVGRFYGLLFFVAIMLGLWLLISIIRSGRKTS